MSILISWQIKKRVKSTCKERTKKRAFDVKRILFYMMTIKAIGPMYFLGIN